MQTNSNNTTNTEITDTEVPLLDPPLKPREEWDEDERLDGRQKTDSIRVLIVPVGEAPYLQTIGNSLEPMQGVVQGLITTFETGIEGVVGVANDEALVDDMPLNRMVPATGSGIFGPFFLAGDGINFHSLSPEEIARCQAVFETPLLPAVTLSAEAATTDTSAATDSQFIEVLVIRPNELPYVERLPFTPAKGYLPALEFLVGAEVAPFELVSFNARMQGMIGFGHRDNTRGNVLDIDAEKFPPNSTIFHLPSMFYGTCIITGSTLSVDELPEAKLSEIELHGLTPEMLETALDVLAPELEHSAFEQIMHGHSKGAIYMGDWD